MKLMGKDITPAKVMAFVGERLAARGLSTPEELELRADGVEARVDPLTFNLQALESNADATQGLPLETHRFQRFHLSAHFPFPADELGRAGTLPAFRPSHRFPRPTSKHNTEPIIVVPY